MSYRQQRYQLLDRVRRRAATASFPYLQTLGVHITPNHFYSPIPDTSKLKTGLWDWPNPEVPGLDFRPTHQLNLLSDYDANYRDEYHALYDHSGNSRGFTVFNPVFGPVDAEVLYCTIRSSQPKKIVEVGSGQSSVVIDLALQQNQASDSAYSCTFDVVDPYPSPNLSRLQHVSTVHAAAVEDMPLTLFADLGPNDILFIDSSHVVRIGNDVHFEYLKVLPSVAKGVLVHVHDIFLPAEYPRDWIVNRRRFWNEQYVLQAFLSYNSAFEIVLAAHYLHLFHRGKLSRTFPSNQESTHGPGSFWIRRTA